MSRYVDGEYMPLVWDGTPDAFYIKGHVSTEVGLATLRDNEVLEDAELDRLGEGIQKYGRWSMDGSREENGQILREYKEPGRGRFKITAFGVGIFAKRIKGNC